MKKIFVSFAKEWLLLWRDKVGLILLFLLPMCLVFFITLTETNDPDKPRQLNILLLNQDKGSLMKTFVKEVKKIDDFNITQVSKQHVYTLETAKKAVADGKYQALIIIPSNASQTFKRHLTNVRLGLKRSSRYPSPAPIEIMTDPALMINLSEQIKASLLLMLKNIEAEMLQQTISQMTHHADASHLDSDAISVKVEHVDIEGKQVVPNPVQQNVPAWALFGMFFIITPLSGVLVKERTLGVMDRLHIAPVSFANLILGKIFAFVLLNLVQLVLMLSVGVFILPLFGFEALKVLEHWWQILVIGLSASLAATGFGMLVGSFVRTPEQANVVGPFLIVIAAAIGGIFVPLYLLPEGFQKISQFSPMHWAHAAFIDVFVRNAGLSQLWPNILKLLALFVVSTWIALMKISYRPN